MPYKAHSPFFLSYLGDTRSLRMPALRLASQAGPMRNPRKGTSVVLRECRTFRSSALSFQLAKSPLMELLLPWNFRYVEHSLLETSAPVELPFFSSERSKNFRSSEISFLWNFRSFRMNRLLQELSLQASKNNLKL